MRRDTLLNQLKRDRGWTIIPLDAGNHVRRTGAQAAIKFQYTIDTLRQMGYAAVGLGLDDLRLDIGELLAPITGVMDAQGKSDLFVCANANVLGFVPTHRVLDAGGLRIGVTAVLGSEAVAKVTQSEIETRSAEEGLRAVVDQLRGQRCDLIVCLAQADDDQCRALAKAVPGIDLIVVASGIGEPRFQPEVVRETGTKLIQTGSKGMYVGAVGVYRGAPPQIRYQRLALDARYPDSPRILTSFAAYQQTLKNQGLSGLGLQPIPHIKGKFVGSETCGDCHTQAYAHWLQTPHHHATDSIAQPTERSNIPRHFDPECLSCHVTGWNPQGYFPYETGYMDLQESIAMHGSGCENCHGPGQAHVAAENGEGDFSDEDLLTLRAQMRLELSKAEEKCMECHDLDNSPDFHLPGAFEKYWKIVEHPWVD